MTFDAFTIPQAVGGLVLLVGAIGGLVVVVRARRSTPPTVLTVAVLALAVAIAFATLLALAPLLTRVSYSFEATPWPS